jgi:hypothetical protein
VPVISYCYETWYVIMSEKHRLRVFESGVLRTTFGPEGDQLIGKWRNLCIEELHNF